MKPHRCRVCGRTDGEARFAPLSPAKCQDCSRAARAARAERLAARPQAAVAPAKDAPPRRRRRRKRNVNEPHLAWVRTLPCSVRGCLHSSVPHHVRLGTGGGTGLKPGDEWTVPLCTPHHDELHQVGALTFEARRQTGSLKDLAERIAARSPFIPLAKTKLKSG